MTDWLELAGRQHTMHALLEVDVSDARRMIRDLRSRIDEPVSFTGFIVACLARAIDEDRSMQAIRKGRGQLALFDDVDVTVAVESDVEGARIPVPHIVRAANRKDVSRIAERSGPAGHRRAVRPPDACCRCGSSCPASCGYRVEAPAHIQSAVSALPGRRSSRWSDGRPRTVGGPGG
jgi:hypothetical protein